MTLEQLLKVIDPLAHVHVGVYIYDTFYASSNDMGMQTAEELLSYARKDFLNGKVSFVTPTLEEFHGVDLIVLYVNVELCKTFTQEQNCHRGG